MAKQLTIKEIASRAGVSPGTVDRILHNRGKVSKEAMEKVSSILRDSEYKHNIHTSAVSLKKEYSIYVCMPDITNGDYWVSIQRGISKALHEYSDVDIRCSYVQYDSSSTDSCESSYKTLLTSGADAFILAPTFEEPTRKLCTELDRMKKPYVFIDTAMEGVNPVSSIMTDQLACGHLLARLVSMLKSDNSEIALFYVIRKGGLRTLNSLEREKGFFDFFQKNEAGCSIRKAFIHMDNYAESEWNIRKFFEDNPKVSSAAVLDSRGHLIADAIKSIGRSDIRTVSFDLTHENRRCVLDGSITALICQNPEAQGFEALKTVIEYLIYGHCIKKHTMPIDIVFKENVDLYSEIIFR